MFRKIQDKHEASDEKEQEENMNKQKKIPSALMAFLSLPSLTENVGSIKILIMKN